MTRRSTDGWAPEEEAHVLQGRIPVRAATSQQPVSTPPGQQGRAGVQADGPEARVLMDLSKLKNPRVLAYGAGGAVVLFLLYRYFAGRGSTGAGQQTQPTPDQTGLTAAEQVGAQEASDVSQLQSDLGGLQGTVDQLTGGGDPAGVATGGTKVHRHRQQHPGKAKHQPKHGTRHRPKPDHPKGHQSNRKHAGSGAVAPSHHGHTPGPHKIKGVKGVLSPARPKAPHSAAPKGKAEAPKKKKKK